MNSSLKRISQSRSGERASSKLKVSCQRRPRGGKPSLKLVHLIGFFAFRTASPTRTPHVSKGLHGLRGRKHWLSTHPLSSPTRPFCQGPQQVGGFTVEQALLRLNDFPLGLWDSYPGEGWKAKAIHPWGTYALNRSTREKRTEMSQLLSEIAEFEVEMRRLFPSIPLEHLPQKADALTPYRNAHARDRFIGWRMARGMLPVNPRTAA